MVNFCFPQRGSVDCLQNSFSKSRTYRYCSPVHRRPCVCVSEFGCALTFWYSDEGWQPVEGFLLLLPNTCWNWTQLPAPLNKPDICICTKVLRDEKFMFKIITLLELNWVQRLWERVIDRRGGKVSHIFYVEKYSNVELFFPATLCHSEN